MQPPFRAEISESNRQGADAWARFAEHRARVTALLLAAGGGSLCVLGPGNLNDLDLRALLAGGYREITLVDLDAGAVRAGLARQGLAHDAPAQIVAPVDLTGILDRLPTADLPPPAEVTALLGRLAAGPAPAVAGAPFDVTASTGVLTQLMQSVVTSSLGPEDTIAVSLAVRNRHLADLAALTAHSMVLVTDVVATSTAPQLDTAGELEPVMAELVAAGNFFTGANPYRLTALVEDRFTDARLTDPWLWPVTPDRRHLTCAIVAKR
jgi:hypothetical protein